MKRAAALWVDGITGRTLTRFPSKAAASQEPILRAVLRPGFAAGMVYSVMAFFAALWFDARGWTPVWMPFTAFALALILLRVVFSGLPDRLGPRRTILTFLWVQIAGLLLMILAPDRILAVGGAFVAGSGYAFIYPSLGRDAVSRVTPAATGRALGYFSACLDLSLAVSGVFLGQLAERIGLTWVFVAAIVGSVLAFWVMLGARPKKAS